MKIVSIFLIQLLFCFTANLHAADKLDFLKVGSEWVFTGDDSTETIKIEEFTEVAKEKVFRVEWTISEPKIGIHNYNRKTEYWKKADDGIVLIGRRNSGFEKIFAKPFYILKFVSGKTWEAKINLGVTKAVLKYSNQGEEEVSTNIGNFQSFRMRMEYEDTIVDEWFSPEIGPVKHTTYKIDAKGNLTPIRTKILSSYTPST